MCIYIYIHYTLYTHHYVSISMDKLFHHLLRQARLEARRLEDAAQGLAKELAESEQMLGVSGAKWPPNSGGFSG